MNLHLISETTSTLTLGYMAIPFRMESLSSPSTGRRCEGDG